MLGDLLLKRSSDVMDLEDLQVLVFSEVPCDSIVSMIENSCPRPVFLKVLSFGQEHQNHLLEIQILGPTPGLVNQSLGIGPAFVFLTSHGDSDELSSF